MIQNGRSYDAEAKLSLQGVVRIQHGVVVEITALSFKAAVDDPARLKSSRTVRAHFGLTPRRFQSGERDNPGRISHASDFDVRATLCHFLKSRTAFRFRAGRP